MRHGKVPVKAVKPTSGAQGWKKKPKDSHTLQHQNFTMVWFIPAALFGGATLLYGFSSVLKNLNSNDNRNDFYSMQLMMLNERQMHMQESQNQIWIVLLLVLVPLCTVVGIIIWELFKRCRVPMYPGGYNYIQGQTHSPIQRGYVQDIDNMDYDDRPFPRQLEYRQGMDHNTRSFQRRREYTQQSRNDAGPFHGQQEYRQQREHNDVSFQRQREYRQRREHNVRPFPSRREYTPGMDNDTGTLHRRRNYRHRSENDTTMRQKHWENRWDVDHRTLRIQTQRAEELDQLNYAIGLSLSKVNKNTMPQAMPRNNIEEIENKEDIDSQRQRHQLSEADLDELEQVNLAIGYSLSEMNNGTGEAQQGITLIPDNTQELDHTSNHSEAEDIADSTDISQDEATEFDPDEISLAIALSRQDDD